MQNAELDYNSSESEATPWQRIRLPVSNCPHCLPCPSRPSQSNFATRILFLGAILVDQQALLTSKAMLGAPYLVHSTLISALPLDPHLWCRFLRLSHRLYLQRLYLNVDVSKLSNGFIRDGVPLPKSTVILNFIVRTSERSWQS